VQGKSSATIKTVAGGAYGAKIVSISCEVDGVQYTGSEFTTAALKSAGAYNLTVFVTDSRGNTASKPVSAFTVYEYKPPYITSFTAERQADGTTVIATLVGGVSPLNGSNGMSYAVTLNDKTLNLPINEYTTNGSLTFTDVDTDSTFVATARVADYYTDTKKSIVVPTEAVTMDFHHSGKGVAFGKVAQEENLLDIAWPIRNCSVPSLIAPNGTIITSGADLNDEKYLHVGNYACPETAVAVSLLNCPTANAFKMTVTNMVDANTSPRPNDWNFLVREITDLYGYKYFQLAWSNTTSGWLFERWVRALDDTIVKDYVVEQGRYDEMWEYTKWSSGKIELWGDVTLTFPAPTHMADYLWRTIVSVDMGDKVTKIISGHCPVQYSGVTPHLSRHMEYPYIAEIVIATSKTFEAFTTTIPIYIIGKWK
jgi:hypothetical protein